MRLGPIYGWTQALDNKKKLPLWRYGRVHWRVPTCWSRLHDYHEEPQHALFAQGRCRLIGLGAEWSIAKRPHFTHLGLTVGGGDGDRNVQLFLAVPGVALWLTIDDAWPRNWETLLAGRWSSIVSERTGKPFYCSEPTDISISWHSGALWWSLWHSTMSWHSTTPKWRSGSFHPIDWLLGRHIYSKVNVGPQVRAIASFPEGDYPLLLQRETATWKRPRWPWAKTRDFVDISVERDAAGFQGKGENSYDCGPDGIYGMSSDGHSYEHAVAKYVEATLKNRRRRGHLEPEHRSIEYPAGVR